MHETEETENMSTGQCLFYVKGEALCHEAGNEADVMPKILLMSVLGELIERYTI
jgi:hypothetical protein